MLVSDRDFNQVLPRNVFTVNICESRVVNALSLFVQEREFQCNGKVMLRRYVRRHLKVALA